MPRWANRIIAGLLALHAAHCLGNEVTAVALTEDETLALISTLDFPTGVEVEFEQSQLTPLFSRVSTQRGVMLKAGGEGLVMRVTQPRAEERKLHEGSVSLTRRVRNRHAPGYRNVTRQMQLDPDRPSHLVLLALEAVLDGEPSIFRKYFSLTGERQGDVWQLRLEPLEDGMRKRISRLWFHGEAAQLLGFRSERDNAAGGFSHFLEVTIHPPDSANAEAN